MRKRLAWLMIFLLLLPAWALGDAAFSAMSAMAALKDAGLTLTGIVDLTDASADDAVTLPDDCTSGVTFDGGFLLVYDTADNCQQAYDSQLLQTSPDIAADQVVCLRNVLCVFADAASADDARTVLDGLVPEDSSAPDEQGEVWIPIHGGKKYHSSQTCSGMDDPRFVTIAEAERLGFTPCKKCFDK